VPRLLRRRARRKTPYQSLNLRQRGPATNSISPATVIAPGGERYHRGTLERTAGRGRKEKLEDRAARQFQGGRENAPGFSGEYFLTNARQQAGGS